MEQFLQPSPSQGTNHTFQQQSFLLEKSKLHMVMCSFLVNFCPSFSKTGNLVIVVQRILKRTGMTTFQMDNSERDKPSIVSSFFLICILFWQIKETKESDNTNNTNIN